jgi:hypothetical protein
LVFYQQVYDQTGIANINGAIFMLMIQVTYSSAFTTSVVCVVFLCVSMINQGFLSLS